MHKDENATAGEDVKKQKTVKNKKKEVFLITVSMVLVIAIIGTVGTFFTGKIIKDFANKDNTLKFDDVSTKNVIVSESSSASSGKEYNKGESKKETVTYTSNSKEIDVNSNGESETTELIDSDSQSQDVNDESTVIFKETANTIQVGSDIDAEAIIVINTSNNEIVAQKNSDQFYYPASITKVMTVLVATDYVDSMKSTFTMTAEIKNACSGAAVAGLTVGEKVTMQDLLYATMLPSGADAALCLAHSIAGSEKNFVALMNKKAIEMGMKNTIFANVTGLHSEAHFSTAYDLAILMSEAIKNETCKEVLSAFQYTTTATTQHPKGLTVSSSFLSGVLPNQPKDFVINAGKTGITGQAGYCLAAVAKSKKNNDIYISIILKCPSRESAFVEQKKLYNNYLS